jgi:hypothetical protein
VLVRFVHDEPARDKGASDAREERGSTMSDSQLTTIARLENRLDALKERL